MNSMITDSDKTTNVTRISICSELIIVLEVIAISSFAFLLKYDKQLWA